MEQVSCGKRTFCVYRNSTSSDYLLSVSSTNQDAGGNFFVKNPGLTEAVPFTLQFVDSAILTGGTTVGTTPIAGVGNNTSLNCSGTDNAKLTVTVNQPDLEGAKIG